MKNVKYITQSCVDTQHVLEQYSAEFYKWIITLTKNNTTESGRELLASIARLLRIDNLPEFSSFLTQIPRECTSIEHINRYCEILREQSYFDTNAERVTVSTIHASKGQEFECVFVLNCVNGSIPLQSNNSVSIDLEEERRILYVALTRAVSECICMVPQYIRNKPVVISNFFSHIPPQLQHISNDAVGESHMRKCNDKKAQLKLF